MSELVDIIFRGDIVSGKNILEVKQALQTRFKLDDAGVEKLFSGKPVLLKKGLSEDQADKFRTMLYQLGALIDTRARTVGNVAEAAKPSGSDSQPAGLSLSEAGGDVLAANERSVFAPAEIDLSALSLSPDKADLLDDKDKADFTPANINTSHIKLTPESDD